MLELALIQHVHGRPRPGRPIRLQVRAFARLGHIDRGHFRLGILQTLRDGFAPDKYVSAELAEQLTTT